MKARARVNFRVAFFILLMASVSLRAQTRNPRISDATTLRAKFAAAFGKDFDLVRDKMTTRTVERGGGTYWLAFVKPKRTGYFYLQYRYLESDPLDIREHEIHFSIGPEKCRRGPPSSSVYGRFCLGDTVIVPVLVNSYAGHEFKVTKAEYTNEKEDPPESTMDSPSLNTSPVDNPALPTVRYAGRNSHKLFHRIPGYTSNLNAEFVAASPGRMNLLVTTSGSGLDINGYDGVPIIVLPVGAPATLIAGREETRGYRKGFDGREYLASTSGNSYMTNVLILQPGDRISVGYFSIVRNSDFVGGRFGSIERDPSQGLKPMINVRPFAPDTRYDFTEWIVDYLPR
jgi:hypothetical protein